eukprot:gb/GFBE01003238.1/.p1 GENE.gb/GFBE01003238.1/~~gb/GFBE01003238.1/.p1  ORF type:complete len:219 (+),score=25.95 gb/GFBE01003238.1/:1-657(+)
MRNSRRQTRSSALLLCAGCSLCFFWSTGPSLQFVAAPSRVSSASTQRRAGPETQPGSGPESEYDYVPFAWATDFTVPAESLQRVMARCLQSPESIWPSGQGSLERDVFRDRIKACASGGELQDRAIDSVFNTFNGGTWLASDRPKFLKQLEEWRGSGSAPDAGALTAGILSARAQVIGAWLFLNVFSTFASYFIIFRPILYTNFGIDFLPGQPRYWEG